MGRVGLGLGITRTWPDWIGLPKRQPAIDPIYGSDQAVRVIGWADRIHQFNGFGLQIESLLTSCPFPPLNGEFSPSFLLTQPHRHAPPLHVSDPPPPTSKLPSSMSSDPHPSYPSTHITHSPFRQTHTHLGRSTPNIPTPTPPPTLADPHPPCPHLPWPIHIPHTHTHLGWSTPTMPTPTLANPNPTYPHPPIHI